MKKLFPGIGALALAGCVGTGTAPVPDEAMALRTGSTYGTLQRGHSVYLAHCGRCHEHVMPKDVSKADWHIVVPGMAWNAGISADQERDLTAYLLAAKR